MSLPAPRNSNESRLARSVRELSCILCHAYINIDAYVGLLMRGVPLETFKGQLKAVGSWHKPLRRMYTSCVVPRAVPKSTSDPPVRHRYRRGCLFLSYSWDSSVYRSIYLEDIMFFLFHLFFFTFSAAVILLPCIPDRQEATKINSVESLMLKLAFGGVQELGWGVETGQPVMIHVTSFCPQKFPKNNL